ncbi:hypothetical protein BGX26_004960 [Mortierella sp. AD094]|nr:hypothetical protein BGX26_004960 [Mortierella sp. AD094]
MNPLELPELRMLIGRFLTTCDILACILVCQAWYQDYKPLLYRSIRLDEATLRLLPKETLRKHAHLFRHLVIMEPMRLSLASLGPWAYPAKLGNTACISPSSWAAANTDYPTMSQPVDSSATPPPIQYNILSLDIHPSILFRKHVHDQVPKHKALIVGTDKYDITKDDFWCLQSTDACIRLIQLNPNLHSLTESWDDMSSFHRIRFANQLCHFKNRLVHLHLSKWEVTPEMLNQLIENSPMLKVLRFSKLTVKKGMGLAVGLREDQPQQSEEPTIPTSVFNFRQLKVFAVSHASFHIRDLNVEAPNLIALCLSFSQVNFTQPNSPQSSLLSSSSSSYAYHHPPKVFWNTPRLERLICNRTETSVANSTLFETPHTLRTISIANYEIESRLVAQFVAAQGLHLESIRLACFSGITARDIKLILTRCPNLVNLSAPEIMMWAGDLFTIQSEDKHTEDNILSSIASRRLEPWVCRKLERLSVYICLDGSAVEDASGSHDGLYQQQHFPSRNASSSPDSVTPCPMDVDKSGQQYQHYQQYQQYQPLAWQQPMQSQTQASHQEEGQKQNHHQDHHCQDFHVHIRHALLDQLAVLTRLRHLDLSGEHVEKVDHVQIGLPWTLKHGLQRLALLRNLEHVAITGWIDEMGVPEIEWMKQSWPNLKRISVLKSNAASMSRFRSLVAEVWPALTVQDKDRNNAHCPPLYLP